LLIPVSGVEVADRPAQLLVAGFAICHRRAVEGSAHPPPVVQEFFLLATGIKLGRGSVA